MTNDQDRALYETARTIASYQGMAHKAMLLYADSIRHDHDALDAASAAWNRTAVHYVHAVQWFPYIVANGINYEPDVYLSYILLGSLSRAKADLLEHEVNGGEMELWEVKQRVDALKKNNKREPKEKSIPLNLMALFVENLEIQAGANYDNVGDIGITLNQVLRDAKAIMEQAK